MRRFTNAPAATPRPLLLGAAFFFAAAFFASRFPNVPGASAGSYASTLAMAAPSFVALLFCLGLRRGLLALGALALFGYAVESVGVATGFPYGTFFYGGSLGGKLFGLVPYLLPVSYVPLIVGAVAAVRREGVSKVRLVVASAVFLVLLDGVLDPGATRLGFWVWPAGGPYYGVPATNFAGWLLSGALAASILLLFWPTERPPLGGLLDGAILSLAFWFGVAVFAGMVFPALLGAALLAFLFVRRSTLLRMRLNSRK